MTIHGPYFNDHSRPNWIKSQDGTLLCCMHGLRKFWNIPEDANKIWFDVGYTKEDDSYPITCKPHISGVFYSWDFYYNGKSLFSHSHITYDSFEQFTFLHECANAFNHDIPLHVSCYYE